MNKLPPDQANDDRRVTPGRRRLHRRVGERRLDTVSVESEARGGGDRRHEGDRRGSAGRRRSEEGRALTRPSVVLFVGEDPKDARVLEELLAGSATEHFELVTAARRAAALDRMTRGD